MIWQSPVTDHSLSSDQIYTNTPSPKGNTMHINTMLSSCSSHTIVHLRHVHIYSFFIDHCYTDINTHILVLPFQHVKCPQIHHEYINWKN